MSGKLKLYSVLNVVGWVTVMPILMVMLLDPFVDFRAWPGGRLVDGTDRARLAPVGADPVAARGATGSGPRIVLPGGVVISAPAAPASVAGLAVSAPVLRETLRTLTPRLTDSLPPATGLRGLTRGDRARGDRRTGRRGRSRSLASPAAGSPSAPGAVLGFVAPVRGHGPGSGGGSPAAQPQRTTPRPPVSSPAPARTAPSRESGSGSNSTGRATARPQRPRPAAPPPHSQGNPSGGSGQPASPGQSGQPHGNGNANGHDKRQ